MVLKVLTWLVPFHFSQTPDFRDYRKLDFLFRFFPFHRPVLLDPCHNAESLVIGYLLRLKVEELHNFLNFGFEFVQTLENVSALAILFLEGDYLQKVVNVLVRADSLAHVESLALLEQLEAGGEFEFKEVDRLYEDAY